MFTKKILRYLLIGLFQLSFFSVSQAAKITRIENIGAPDEIAFFNEKGEKCFLDQFEGKTILLVFWATWCSPCIKEMPDLDWLQKDFRKLPFEVIAVSQDFQGIKIIKDFFKGQEIRYLKVYHDYQNQLFKAFSVVGLPTSFLINPSGKIVVSFTGIVNWYDSEVRDIILSHIPGNPEMPKNSYKAQDLNKAVKPTTATSKEEADLPSQTPSSNVNNTTSADEAVDSKQELRNKKENKNEHTKINGRKNE